MATDGTSESIRTGISSTNAMQSTLIFCTKYILNIKYISYSIIKTHNFELFVSHPEKILKKLKGISRKA